MGNKECFANGDALYSRVNGDKKKSGLIRKYGLNMSRQAFREKAEDIGFHKVRCCRFILARGRKVDKGERIEPKDGI